MKKTYTKPGIVFESFLMDTNIAGDCEVKTNTPSKSQCGINYGPFVVFLDATGSLCTGAGRVPSTGGDGDYNGLCYHVPTGDKNLFNS